MSEVTREQVLEGLRRLREDIGPEPMRAAEQVAAGTALDRAIAYLEGLPEHWAGAEFKNWPWNLVHGVGGFLDFERYEYVVFEDRDVSLVRFVVRALANPKCEGSEEVLLAIDAIRANREKP